MEAAKTGAPRHPELPCNTGCKARQSCEQAPARHTSIKPSPIQGETAKGRSEKAPAKLLGRYCKKGNSGRRQGPDTWVAIGSRWRRHKALPGASWPQQQWTATESSSQRVALPLRNYVGSLHAQRHSGTRPRSTVRTGGRMACGPPSPCLLLCNVAATKLISPRPLRLPSRKHMLTWPLTWQLSSWASLVRHGWTSFQKRLPTTAA